MKAFTSASLALRLSFFAAVIISISAFFVLSSPVHAYDHDIPIHAFISRDDGFAYTIDAVAESNTSYKLYLPASVSKPHLTLIFTGNGAVEYGGRSYERGDKFEVNAARGSVTLKYRGTEIKVTVATASEIPSVYIDLDGGYKAFAAVCASKSHEESGDISVLAADGGIVYQGELEKFKGHGFTSFVASNDTTYKNSYNIKLAEKAELIHGAGEIKKWVLLSPRMYDGSRDKTGLSQLFAYRTFTGLSAGRSFGIVGEYVDLYINGEYRGVYILCERMNDGGAIDVSDLDEKVSGRGQHETVNVWTEPGDEAIKLGIREYRYDKSARKTADADITGGYVLEVMCNTYENCGFITKNGVFFSIKSPEFCSQEMVRYIASYVQRFENAIFSETGYNDEGRHYSEYADVESLADMILVYAYYQNFEFFRTSTYIYKNADGKKYDTLTFGPVWDFETPAEAYMSDNSLFGTWSWFTYFVPQQYVWAEQLWQHGGFMNVMFQENERMRTVIDELLPTIDDMVSDVSESMAMSASRWHMDEYGRAARYYISAVKKRYDDWFGRLWGDDFMLYLGIDSSRNDDGTVTLTARSNVDTEFVCSWFVLDPGDMTKYEEYELGVASITVKADDKMYFCRLEGKNNAFLPQASGQIFSKEKIAMVSTPVTAVTAVPETAPSGTIAPDGETTGGCGSSIGVMNVFAAATIAVAFGNKKISFFKRRRKDGIPQHE